MDWKFELDLEKDLESLILSNAIRIKYRKGDVIVSQGLLNNQTAFITYGLLKLYIEKPNNNLLLYHIFPKNNRVLTLMNFINELPPQFSIMALEESTLLWVSNVEILEWSKKFPSLKRMMKNSYSFSIQQLINSYNELVFLSIEERLFNYLRTKGAIYKSQELKISRTEIASDLGTSISTISRAIRQLETKNRIIGKPNSIILVDQSDLP